ncbi:MAG TPA: hypothetical protein VJ036_07870 [bacterium]|nr:hypothetical protein [bacterium]
MTNKGTLNRQPGKTGWQRYWWNRIVPGKVDLVSGKLELGDLEQRDYDDVLLDDLAEMVLSSKGKVVLLPQERIPVTTGAAAVYRY